LGISAVNIEIERTCCNNLKVTIGVCAKNCGAIIKGAINSISDQDYPHELMEIIFVDDGSSDNTLSVIQGILPRLDIKTKLFHHEWRGLGVTRNVVVKNASGEYIIWVDGDMTLSKDFVRRQVEFMEQDPPVGIGKGKYGLSGQGNLISDLENMEFAIANLRCRGKAGSTPLGTGGSIYRVEAIRQVGGFDNDITGSGEDMDAEQRISAAGWLLDVTSAVFYERRRKTWNSLWNEYFWHGKGNSYLFEKGKKSFDSKKLLLPLSIKVEVTRMVVAYKLTGRKVALLLPLHYAFKRTAWFLGFMSGLLQTGVNN
jgi:glycosyltransferase involved in cell wall biosynthesis